MNINNLTGTNLLVVGNGSFVFPPGTTEAQLSPGSYSVASVGNFQVVANYSTNYVTNGSGMPVVSLQNAGGQPVYWLGYGELGVGALISLGPQPAGGQLAFSDTTGGGGDYTTSIPYSDTALLTLTRGSTSWEGVWMLTGSGTSAVVTTNWVTNGSPGSVQFGFTLDKEYDSIDLRQGEAIAYNTGFMRQEDTAAFSLGFDLGLWLCGVYLGTKIVFEILKERTIGTAD
jgi:hypothetical protein